MLQRRRVEAASGRFKPTLRAAAAWTASYMRYTALLLIAIACFAFATAQQGLVLQDESSALYIDDQLRIVDLIDTRRPLPSFLAPLHDWWAAEYVFNNINGAFLHAPHRIQMMLT